MAIIDLHCDTISSIWAKSESLQINSGHFDLERAQRVKMRMQICAMYTPPSEGSISLRQTLKQIDYFYQEIEANREKIYQVISFSDIVAPQNRNLIGCLLHLEGAEALGNEVEMLRLLYRLGLRSLGLTWNYRNMLADGVGEGQHGAGLSTKGRQMVREMKRLNIILDLAHAGSRSFYEAMEVYSDPVMVSHANAKALCDHPRNLDDSQLRALAQNDGIVGVTLVSDFVSQEKARIQDLLDHIVYISDLIGVHHVALGSDFDGASDMVMPGVEAYINWEALLCQRGFSAAEINMIMQNNALRLFEAIL